MFSLDYSKIEGNKRKTSQTEYNKKYRELLIPVRRSLRLKQKFIEFYADSEPVAKKSNKLIQIDLIVDSQIFTRDVYILILKHCAPKTIINFGLTCRQNNITSRLEIIWKCLCWRDFNLIEPWVKGKYMQIYSYFYIANILSKWTDVFKPQSRLKISFMSWYLTNRNPPHQSMSLLSLMQIQKLWGITYLDLLNYQSNNNNQNQVDFVRIHPINWSSAYDLSIEKFGSVRAMQRAVLQRCRRNTDILKELFQLYNTTTKFSKFYDSNGNQIRFLIKNLPQGSVAFYKQFREFIREFQSWVIEKNQDILKNRPPEMMIEDFCVGIHFAIKQLNSGRRVGRCQINKDVLMNWAKTHSERYIEMLKWQSANDIKTISCTNKWDLPRGQTLLLAFLETGDAEDLNELKSHHLRLKRINSWMRKHKYIEDFPKPFSTREFPHPYIKFIKLAGLNYINTGIEEDFKKFSRMALRHSKRNIKNCLYCLKNSDSLSTNNSTDSPEMSNSLADTPVAHFSHFQTIEEFRKERKPICHHHLMLEYYVNNRSRCVINPNSVINSAVKIWYS
ncbi:hypothetical protein HZS_2385 [Henneguya salminicola]|nr:hypothetical protein HZS_2385 [Henneguya salminicola]